MKKTKKLKKLKPKEILRCFYAIRILDGQGQIDKPKTNAERKRFLARQECAQAKRYGYTTFILPSSTTAESEVGLVQLNILSVTAPKIA